jgi:hypothetical protein
VHPELARALASEPRWRAVARFGRLWHATSSALRAWIPFVFLEYDAEHPDAPVAVPSVFAALDSPLGEAPSRGCPELAAAREFAVALLGTRFDGERSDQLELCFRALHGQARVLHVAVMLGREAQSVRLSTWIGESQSVAHLEALGLRDAAEPLERLLTVLPVRPRHLQIDFDIGPPVGSRIGLGCRPEGLDEWRELLDRLVRRDLCDPDKAAALLCWPEGSDRGAACVRRELSHVKLGCEPGGRIEVKCYFGATRTR